MAEWEATGGSRAPYDEEPGFCVRCGSKIKIQVETDGNGHLVEWPGPCQACGRGVHTPFGMPFRRSALPPRIAPAPRHSRRDGRALIRAALLRGVPIGVVVREVGVTRQAVVVVRHVLEAEGRTLTCRCGKAAFHIGRCLGRRVSTHRGE